MGMRASNANCSSASPPADRPNRERMFFGQPNFFCFMPDEQAFALSQSVLHLLHTNLDVQHLTAVGQGKPQYGVVLRRSAWPEG